MDVRCLNCFETYDDEFNICPHCGSSNELLNNEEYHLVPGTILNDRYIIGKSLSFGGFGIVYKAWDNMLDIAVAIKEYFPAALARRDKGASRVNVAGGGNKIKIYKSGIELFIEEARSTAKFGKHPNITNVYGYFEENNTAYMVMELLEGVTLKKYLQSKPEDKISVDESIDILLSVINALKEVHKSGMLHRDISPDNIFICANNQIKLIDFGAAKFADYENEKTREIVLKPGYAPPEQYDSKSIQAPWTDIYALGATMYRAITGEVPDESTNRVEEDKVKTPREFDSSVPEYIDSALMRAMSITPEFRFRTVQEFEDAIVGRKIMRSEKEQRKHLLRKRLILAASLLCVIAVGAGVFMNNMHQQKMAAELEECTISVWMPVDQDENTAKTVYDSMVNEFKTEYEQVTLDVEFVKSSEYKDKLTKALENGEGPTVFDGSYLNENTKQYAADVSDIFQWIDKGQYNFFDNYEKYFPEKKQIPLGFTIPLIYTNKNMLDDKSIKIDKNDWTAFSSQKSTFLVAGNDSYSKVQNALPGLYNISTLSSDNIQGHFNLLWSVGSSGDKKEIKAGIRLIYYFLGEQAQDALFVQRVNGYPINKEMLNVYIQVNPEMKFIKDEIGHIYFDTNDLILTDKNYYNDLYKSFASDKEKINELKKKFTKE